MCARASYHARYFASTGLPCVVSLKGVPIPTAPHPVLVLLEDGTSVIRYELICSPALACRATGATFVAGGTPAFATLGWRFRGGLKSSVHSLLHVFSASPSSPIAVWSCVPSAWILPKSTNSELVGLSSAICCLPNILGMPQPSNSPPPDEELTGTCLQCAYTCLYLAPSTFHPFVSSRSL